MHSRELVANHSEVDNPPLPPDPHALSPQQGDLPPRRRRTGPRDCTAAIDDAVPRHVGAARNGGQRKTDLAGHRPRAEPPGQIPVGGHRARRHRSQQVVDPGVETGADDADRAVAEGFVGTHFGSSVATGYRPRHLGPGQRLEVGSGGGGGSGKGWSLTSVQRT